MAQAPLTARQKWALAGMAAVLLALVLPSVVYGLRAAWVDASTAAARRVVNGWREGYGPGYSTERWEQTRATLEEGVRTDPNNAQLHVDLGYLYVLPANVLEPLAKPDSPLAQYRLDLLDQALGHYRRVTELRPMFPYGWGYVALAKLKRGQVDEEMWAAFDKAVRYGRFEGGVQLSIAEVAFSQWKRLTPERMRDLRILLEHPNPEVKKDIAALAQRAGVAPAELGGQ